MVAACRYVDRVIPDPPMVVDAPFSIALALHSHATATTSPRLSENASFPAFLPPAVSDRTLYADRVVARDHRARRPTPARGDVAHPSVSAGVSDDMRKAKWNAKRAQRKRR